MKSSMALPGLEPDSSGSDEGRLAEVADNVAQVSGNYGAPTTALGALDAGLPALNCSNVANALHDLLELAREAGIEPAHPIMQAAAAELDNLASYIARPPSGER